MGLPIIITHLNDPNFCFFLSKSENQHQHFQVLYEKFIFLNFICRSVSFHSLIHQNLSFLEIYEMSHKAKNLRRRTPADSTLNCGFSVQFILQDCSQIQELQHLAKFLTKHQFRMREKEWRMLTIFFHTKFRSTSTGDFGLFF